MKRINKINEAERMRRSFQILDELIYLTEKIRDLYVEDGELRGKKGKKIDIMLDVLRNVRKLEDDRSPEKVAKVKEMVKKI